MVYRRYFKRCIDFCLSLVMLILLSPVIIVVASSLYFANKGAGVFFLQERPGKNEKIFKVIKFKTMTDERGADGELLSDAERLTPIGKIVRSLSLDELPQLINVLKGDMSFIGPRPLLVRYLPFYTEREHLRHSVWPGITGWAQVNGRNYLPWNERLERDVWYVEHISFSLDCKILFMTVRNVLARKDIVIGNNDKMEDLDKERSNGAY